MGRANKALVASLSSLVFASCANLTEPLKTRVEYHRYVTGLPPSVSEPLLIYGFEKPRAERPRLFCISTKMDGVRRLEIPSRLSDRASGEIRDWYDEREQLLTHIYSLSPDRGTSVLFSVYKEVREMSDIDSVAALSLGALENTGKYLTDTIFDLDPTHVFLLATGWRNDPELSIRHYDEWIRSIDSAFSGEEFRPLYIGVTWQSGWSLFSPASVLTKGNDADELGFGWINVLVNEVLAGALSNADSDARVMLIGHSYGTRLLGHAAIVPTALGANTESVVDLFVGFQPAFPITRYGKDRGKEPLWPPPRATPSVLTSSVHDEAGKPTGKYVLGLKRDGYKQRFPNIPAKWATAKHDGVFRSDGMEGEELVLVDVSAFVDGKGSKYSPHNDVFGVEAGRFIKSSLQIVRKQ